MRESAALRMSVYVEGELGATEIWKSTSIKACEQSKSSFSVGKYKIYIYIYYFI